VLTPERSLGNVRQVVWQALGDRDEIEDLLQYVGGIGKQYATGWGEVDAFRVLPCDADPATCGFAYRGGPARNVPVPMLATLGIASDIVVRGRIEPPYAIADGTMEVAAPLLKHLVVSEDEAREAFRY
jgi:hypothetical protein